jgi:hypothetical protein
MGQKTTKPTLTNHKIKRLSTKLHEFPITKSLIETNSHHKAIIYQKIDKCVTNIIKYWQNADITIHQHPKNILSPELFEELCNNINETFEKGCASYCQYSDYNKISSVIYFRTLEDSEVVKYSIKYDEKKNCWISKKTL